MFIKHHLAVVPLEITPGSTLPANTSSSEESDALYIFKNSDPLHSYNLNTSALHPNNSRTSNNLKNTFLVKINGTCQKSGGEIYKAESFFTESFNLLRCCGDATFVI